MSPRERWLAAVEARRADRVACDYSAVAAVNHRLMRQLGCDSEQDLWIKLGVDRHPLVEVIMARVYEIDAEIVRRVLAAAGGLTDFVYVSEAAGGHEPLLHSPGAFLRYPKRWLVEMTQLVHACGVKVLHFGTSLTRSRFRDLLEIEIDVLRPVWWLGRGMVGRALAHDFGYPVAFHGFINNHRAWCAGLPRDVRREAAANARRYSGRQGYIAAPCHLIGANLPTANILAL
ncbi:MAG: hypothetical protein IT160_09665 [Bryobacterales bacterium]|nr:hypothetical protein [Bryobacterales bacterium]